MSVAKLSNFLCFHLYTKLPWWIVRRKWVGNLLLPQAGAWAYPKRQFAYHSLRLTRCPWRRLRAKLMLIDWRATVLAALRSFERTPSANLTNQSRSDDAAQVVSDKSRDEQQ